MNLDLPTLSFEEIEAEGTITVKQTMWDAKAQWESLPLPGTRDYFQSLDPRKVRTGEVGLYMQPYINYHGALLYLPWLDVEHPRKHHDSVQANIEVAQELYYLLDTLEMAKDLVVGLSGNGLRFTWPWIVPYQYTGAFLALVNDNNRFSGIDPSPQKGTNKFLRTFAYRGNKRQGNPTSKVSIHYLDNAAELLTLDPAQYKEEVSGKPDVDRYVRDIDRVMPRAIAPPEAIQVFDEYAFKLKIGSTIAMPGSPRISHSRGINWDRVYSYLEEEGITARKHEYGTTDILKLDFCPSCGRKEGNPYITPSGGLKCFRSNNCEAGQDEKGLAPSKWVPGYTQPDGEEQGTEVPGMGLEEARASLTQAMRATEDIVAGASPGVGKTFAALEHYVPLAQNRLVLYTAPSHKLAQEVYHKVLGRGTGVNVRYLQGRNEETCFDLDAVKYATSRGYLPARTVCLTCSYKGSCEYSKQFKDLPLTGMVFSAHQMAKYLVSRICPQTWIIDENPLMQFFEKKEVTQDEMDEFMLTESGDVQPLLKEIRDVCLDIAAKLKAGEIGKLFVGDAPPGNWENAVILEDISPAISKYFDLDFYPCASSGVYTDIENPVVWENINFKRDVNLKCTHWWDQVIERDPAMSLYIRIEKSRGKVEVTYTSVILDTPEFQDCQTVHLDGTVYEPEIQEIFPGDIERVDAQAHLNTTRKVHIMISRGKVKVKKLGKKQKKQDLGRLMGRLRPGDKKVLLITYKDQEEYLLDLAKGLRPDLTFGIIHFWGPRGINAYEDYDACLVYGTPTVSPAGVEDLASALFSEQEDMDKWKASLGRRDLTQAIHRIRPVNGDKNIVVMGSYWPTEYLGHPDEKIDLMRKGSNVEEATRRLTDFALEYGFIDKPVANMLGVGTKTDRNAVEAWQERLSGTQGGQSDRLPTLISILYKSGESVEGTPPAVYLHKNGQWDSILSQIQEETGLPILGSYKAPGKGGRSLVLGTVEKMVEFYDSIGSVLDMDSYSVAGQ